MASFTGVSACSRSSPFHTLVQLASFWAGEVAAVRQQRNDRQRRGLIVDKGNAFAPQQVANSLGLKREVETGNILGG